MSYIRNCQKSHKKPRSDFQMQVSFFHKKQKHAQKCHWRKSHKCIISAVIKHKRSQKLLIILRWIEQRNIMCNAHSGWSQYWKCIRQKQKSRQPDSQYVQCNKSDQPSHKFLQLDFMKNHYISENCINKHKNWQHIKEIKIADRRQKHRQYKNCRWFSLKNLLNAKKQKRKINHRIQEKRMHDSCI